MRQDKPGKIFLVLLSASIVFSLIQCPLCITAQQEGKSNEKWRGAFSRDKIVTKLILKSVIVLSGELSLMLVL